MLRRITGHGLGFWWWFSHFAYVFVMQILPSCKYHGVCIFGFPSIRFSISFGHGEASYRAPSALPLRFFNGSGKFLLFVGQNCTYCTSVSHVHCVVTDSGLSSNVGFILGGYQGNGLDLELGQRWVYDDGHCFNRHVFHGFHCVCYYFCHIWIQLLQ